MYSTEALLNCWLLPWLFAGGWDTCALGKTYWVKILILDVEAFHFPQNIVTDRFLLGTFNEGEYFLFRIRKVTFYYPLQVTQSKIQSPGHVIQLAFLPARYTLPIL